MIFVCYSTRFFILPWYSKEKWLPWAIFISDWLKPTGQNDICYIVPMIYVNLVLYRFLNLVPVKTCRRYAILIFETGSVESVVLYSSARWPLSQDNGKHMTMMGKCFWNNKKLFWNVPYVVLLKCTQIEDSIEHS